jgi:hypothetical protein
MVLWGLGKCVWWSSKACRGVKGGWQIRIDNEGRKVEEVWVRRRTWNQWTRRFVRTKMKGDDTEEVVVATERSNLLG